MTCEDFTRCRCRAFHRHTHIVACVVHRQFAVADKIVLRDTHADQRKRRSMPTRLQRPVGRLVDGDAGACHERDLTCTRLMEGDGDAIREQVAVHRDVVRARVDLTDVRTRIRCQQRIVAVDGLKRRCASSATRACRACCAGRAGDGRRRAGRACGASRSRCACRSCAGCAGRPCGTSRCRCCASRTCRTASTC